MTSASTCTHCDLDHEHCHGTVVCHPDGTRECTEAGCPGHAAAHEWEIGCEELGERCAEPGCRRVA